MAIFEGIGKISDYTHLRSLRREMKYRIKTGTSLAQAMGTPVQPGRAKSSEPQKTQGKADANREAQIRQKLRQGQKLSSKDKQYLKENNPDLYEKVERIEERREMLARALKRAKTKDEAMRAVAQANIAVLSEMQKGGGDMLSFSGAGGGSSEGTGSSVMTAGGEAAAGDALDADPAMSDAASPAGAAQDAPRPDAAGGEPAAEAAGADHAARANGKEEREGFQPGPSTRDSYGNRRVLSREEMDDMLQKAQQAGKLSPLDNEKVYLLRALQREWMEYAGSEAYKNLPNTALDAAEEERGVRRRPRQTDGVSVRAAVPSAAEVLAAAQRYYHTALDGERFAAKG